MPSVEQKACGAITTLRMWLLGLALMFCSSSLLAFTPASSPLLSAAAVTPNLMLLVDNSGSMNSLIRAADFDQSLTTWPQVYSYGCYSFYGCYSSALSMTDENILIGNLYQSGCNPSYYYGFRWGTSNTLYCLNLPDPVGGGNTRYSARYISYLISKMSGTTKDYTDGSIPNDYRINVARNAATAIVNANRSLRIGLASYNAPRGGDSGPGGNISRSIADLQATTTTTSAQATTNYNNLLSAIAALGATSNTPLAETYYEVTRYMRGLYPFYNYNPLISGTRYTSPIQYRCQKNYGVVITDGLPTYDRTFPTSSSDDANGDPVLGLSGSGTLPNWDGINNDGANLNGDGEGDTLYLDDIAKFAYDIDMRTANNGNDLAGKGWDSTDFPKQNMSTFTVGFTTTQQMLSDAANYGHGSYYQASDSATLSAALNTALSSINSKAGSGGAGVSSASTLSNSTTYYQTTYDPTDWRGTIRSYPYSSDGTVSTTLSWTTDTTIVPGGTSPTFESWNGTSVISLAYANYATAQQATLNANLPTGLTGNDLINWSKGVNKTGLRARTVLLGDIINSPLIYASPNVQTASNTGTDTSYTGFLTTKASNMNPLLVVNANDGFTDVINPANGARLYAYLPSNTLPLLYTVANTNYINGTSHTFLNDGQITVADVQINGGWKTVSFDGTGAGGKTFSAIQLFDASTGNTLKALWEISAPATSTPGNSLNDLGYAYAKPEIARLPDGRWAAFIANGYGSNSGVAALYVINVADGSLITKLVVDSTETTNGLSSVKLQVDATSTVVAAYGGDLKGRMWKFDLSSTSISAWGLAFSGKPLFTAPGGTSQPITAQPLLVNNNTSGLMVYFGTGKFNETVDKTSTSTQSFYAIWDKAGGSGNYTVANLAPQTITGSFTGTNGTYMTTSTNKVDYTTQYGWYLPLTYNNSLIGERVIYQAYYSYGRILFTTAGVDTTDPCSSQGFGRLVVLDALSGGMLTTAVLDTNGDNAVNTSDVASSGRIYTSGIPTLTAVVTIQGTNSTAGSISLTMNNSGGGPPGTERMNLPSGSARIMWRQIQ